MSPDSHFNWLLVFKWQGLGIGYYGRPVNKQDSTQAFINKYQKSLGIHVSQPYSNVDLTLELKILILLHLDMMLDDFQTRLSWSNALNALQ